MYLACYRSASLFLFIFEVIACFLLSDLPVQVCCAILLPIKHVTFQGCVLWFSSSIGGESLDAASHR